ncbi:hypothetical protein SAMN05444682_102326 [Parapedobacter indicus]|uniref:Uncharacterized protein n=1 Tax=Parapedobacter indicus TaxID=1477437 RepID=A0A1I3FGN9_9SPHI|nr:hypothetical protein CLV26_102326 [Parapedobacter indicus]SFI10398.1 hypothetical protein SAMN05444682_102326 [Parapedobacter indicus]
MYLNTSLTRINPKSLFANAGRVKVSCFPYTYKALFTSVTDLTDAVVHFISVKEFVQTEPDTSTTD